MWEYGFPGGVGKRRAINSPRYYPRVQILLSGPGAAKSVAAALRRAVYTWC